MALPSQLARPTTGRLSTGPSRQHRAPGALRKPLLALGALAVAIVVLWTLWPKLTAKRSGEVAKPTATKTAIEHTTKPKTAGTGMAPGVGRLADLASRSGAENQPPSVVMGAKPGATTTKPPVTEPAPTRSLAASDANKPVTPPPAPVSEPVSQPAANQSLPPGQPATTEMVPPTSTEPTRAGTVQALIEQGDSAMARGSLVEARDAFNRAFWDTRATGNDLDTLRGKLAAISEKLTFSPIAAPDDTMAQTYEISGGDNLNRVTRDQDLKVDWRFIQRINQISDPRRLRVGQKVKLIKGPFHAIIDKSDFRLDLYATARDSAGNRFYIRSFRVGLGEAGGTPLGHWNVRPSSKLVDPAWVNPRTGESFTADDPMNPIGERWVGIDGIDPSNKDKLGFGIHGTIDHDSVGKEMSMGCVRMLPEDIEVIYELMVESGSEIEIKP